MKLTDIIIKYGIDKFAHFGLGGMIASIIDILLLITVCPDSLLWVFLIGFAGDIMASISGLIKDYCIDDIVDTKDILWTVYGGLSIHIAITIGVLINLIF